MKADDAREAQLVVDDAEEASPAHDAALAAYYAACAEMNS